MKLIDKPISLNELKQLAKQRFGDLVKAVVDVNKRIMVIDADLHADEEGFLLERGSQQQDLWGINLYPDLKGADWLEFDSMINLRPSQDNRSRSVDDRQIREKIVKIVNQLVKK